MCKLKEARANNLFWLAIVIICRKKEELRMYMSRDEVTLFAIRVRTLSSFRKYCHIIWTEVAFG